jgi:hypothetical protein
MTVKDALDLSVVIVVVAAGLGVGACALVFFASLARALWRHW